MRFQCAMDLLRRNPIASQGCLYLKVNFILAVLPVHLCNSGFSSALLVTAQQFLIPNSKVRSLAGSVCVLS